MPGVTARLKSMETVIAAVAATVAALAKYAAISSVLPLPVNLTGFAVHLSTLVMLVLMLLFLLMSGHLQRWGGARQAALVAVLLTAGVGFAIFFASGITRHSVPVECADYPAAQILEPREPSVRLSRMLASAGGLPDAWCDHEDTKLLRSTVEREAAGLTSWLTVLLIAAEALLAMALASGAWFVAAKSHRR